MSAVREMLFVRPSSFCHIIPTKVSKPELGTTDIHRSIHLWHPWSVDFSNDVMARPQFAARGHNLQIRLTI